MQDKQLMENLLLLEKGACDLYLHGTIESWTEQVHQTFQTALNSSLHMESDLYDQMTAKGWYTEEQAQGQKVNTVKQKYSNR